MSYSIMLKELKEKKSLLLLGLVLCFSPLIGMAIVRAVLPVSELSAAELSFCLAWTFFTLLSTIFPIILTSSAISGEIEKNSMGFLLSLPLSRRRIWVSKLVTFFGIILLSQVLFHVLNREIIDQFLHVRLQLAEVIFLIPVLLVLPFFAAGVTFFVSSLLHSEMLTVLAGIFGFCLSLACLFGYLVLMLWDANGIDITVLLLLLTCAFLVSSLVVFLRSEPVKRSFPKFKTVAVIFPVSLLIAGLFSLPLYFFSKTTLRSDAATAFPYFKVSTGQLVMEVIYRPNLYGFKIDRISLPSRVRLHLLNLSDKSIREIPGIDVDSAMGFSVSPDGEKILIRESRMYYNLLAFILPRAGNYHVYCLRTGMLRKLPCTSNLNTGFFWVDPDTVGILDMEDEGNLMVSVLTLMDTEGKVLNVGRLVPDPDQPGVISQVQVVKGEIYLYQRGCSIKKHRKIHKFHRKAHMYRYDRSGNTFIRLAEIDGGEGGYAGFPYELHSDFPFRPLSPDGTEYVYHLLDADGVLHFHIGSLESKAERELDLSVCIPGYHPGAIKFEGLSWMDNGMLLLAYYSKSDEIYTAFLDPRTLTVVDMGKKKVVSPCKLNSRTGVSAYLTKEKTGLYGERIVVNFSKGFERPISVTAVEFSEERVYWCYLVDWADDSSVLLYNRGKIMKISMDGENTEVMDVNSVYSSFRSSK